MVATVTGNQPEGSPRELIGIRPGGRSCLRPLADDRRCECPRGRTGHPGRSRRRIPGTAIVHRKYGRGLLSHCSRTIVGVAVPLERFYKPEPGAAHNPRLQTIGQTSLTVF